MDKLIPDPPTESTTPLEEAIRADNLEKNREAIKRALDFYLCPEPAKPRQPSTMFLIYPKIDTESLLAHACESLASANTLAGNFAGGKPGIGSGGPAGLIRQAHRVIVLREQARSHRWGAFQKVGASLLAKALTRSPHH
ncbi:hypothetical protein [Pseudomonas sp. S49]|uniref:DUF6124 family protein n=1 Tax=Pseudomonas sp. S49 TaxID=1573720 RepID=UPI001EECEDB7|nr:hypothetical protein [Pseudomonas sp. S49]